jgi:hypothetical protein
MSACQPVTKGRTIKSTKSSATAFRGKHHIQTFKEYSFKEDPMYSTTK